MDRYSHCLVLFCLLLVGEVRGQDPQPSPSLVQSTARIGWPGLQPNDQLLLPNGWSLTPQGEQIALGDFPVNVQIDPTGQFAAVLHCGYGQHEVRIVSIKDKQAVSSARIEQGFYGLAFVSDGKFLAVSGGEDEQVYLFPYQQGYLAKPRILQLGNKQDKFVVSGLANAGDDLLACGLLGNELRFVSLDNGSVRKATRFQEQSYPYAACVDEESGTAYVSLWGKAEVAAVDLKTGEIRQRFPVLSHPTEMTLVDQGKLLYVACSNDNGVVLLDTNSGKQLEVIKTSLYPNSRNGSTPSSVCVSADQKVLMVANADNNNIAVFDIQNRGTSHSLGFIPVGWYPTSVRVGGNDESLIVANGKGLTSRSNPHGANPNKNPPATVREYIGGLMQGALSIISMPSPAEMARMTRLAFLNSPLNAENSRLLDAPAGDNPVPRQSGDQSPIKHCVYIIKENRTYDQVFGDIPRGNGDSTLCIFPERVTPNHHALVNEFVLLDNFYVESEVSADGHEWTMAAYATDFVEKTWPLTYRGGRGKLTYPSEGKLKIAEPSSGYFWDKCREKGVSYYSFGEFIENGATPDAPATTKVEALQGHFDPLYRSYDLEYPDVLRAKRFVEKWKEFEAAGTLPQFMVVRLPNDHTYGTRVGKRTPTAMVAENDLALGLLIEAISKTESWKKTAVFVVEDDAQNGADHVDAHRTVAMVLSPYTRHGRVDSTMYSTSSMLRTMGLILGLDPMTQFDAAATPMYSSFQATPDFTPFQHREPEVDINAINQATAWGADLSEQLDLSREDAADDLLFGDIIWRSVKGADHPAPPPVRAAYVFREAEEEEEEEEEENDDSGESDELDTNDR